MSDAQERADVDNAYREAARALVDKAGVQRRRAAVLAAVRDDKAGTARHIDRPASNESRRWTGATWWRGAAAACVLGLSTLLVLRLGDDAAVSDAIQRGASAGRADTADGAAQAPQGSTAASPSAAAVARTLPTPAANKAAPAPPASPSPAPAQPPVLAERATPSPPTTSAGALRSPFPANGPPTEERAARGEAGPASPGPADGDRRVEDAMPSKQAAEMATSRSDAGVQRAAKAATESSPAAADAPTPGALAAGQRSSMQASAPRLPGSLLAAAAAGDLEGLRQRLATARPDDEQDPDGRTALTLAVLRSDAQLVSLLIARGANRLRPDRHGRTPLDYAISINDPAVLEALNRL